MAASSINTQLVENMFRMSRIMKQKLYNNSEIAELSLLQTEALLYLQKQTDAQMMSIVERFHITKPTATSLLNKLVDQKLVKRIPSKTDRRVVNISLTSRGEVLLEKVVKERNERINKLLTYLSDTEKKQLSSILSSLIVKLEQENNHE
jgi:DNA-binding MarR family transcriptional regulator